MALPLLLIPAAAVAAGVGAKKGYDGYKKSSQADDLVANSSRKYNEAKKKLDSAESNANSSLEMLGNTELEIGKTIAEFSKLANSLLAQLDSRTKNDLNLNIPKHQLNKIEDYSISAVSIMGDLTGAGAAGAAAGFAAYGGVMTLGAASTGTKIAALTGVAKTNATLAALGGGAKAAGGLGMVGGQIVLGATVAAPVALVAGFAYSKHAEKKLKNANKVEKASSDAIKQIWDAIPKLRAISESADEVNEFIAKLSEEFAEHFLLLKNIDGLLGKINESVIDGLTEDALRLIENGYALAAIMVDVILTPFFQVKKEDGEVVLNEDNNPIIEVDDTGFSILNKDGLDEALAYGAAQAEKFFEPKP